MTMFETHTLLMTQPPELEFDALNSLTMTPRNKLFNYFMTGWHSNITLDASDSYDPDVILGESHADLIYTWYCRQENTSFPANMTDSPNLQTTGKLSV